jgi:hypothetical protein
MFERSAHDDIGWSIADPDTELPPDRYLGAFGDLPLADGEPGEWCDVVMHDSLGEMRWTFVLVLGRSQCVTDRHKAEPRRLFPKAPRRGRALRGLREWEREDEAAAASSAPFRLRPAAGIDGRTPSRRLGLLRTVNAR